MVLPRDHRSKKDEPGEVQQWTSPTTVDTSKIGFYFGGQDGKSEVHSGVSGITGSGRTMGNTSATTQSIKPRYESDCDNLDQAGKIVSTAGISKAICMIENKHTKHGTGFYFGDCRGQRCLMTCCHVIPNIKVGKNTTLTFDWSDTGYRLEVPCQPDEFFWTCPKLDDTVSAFDGTGTAAGASS